MQVRDLLERKASSLITVEPKTELRKAIRLLIHNQIGGLPVLGHNGAPVGLLAERDVVRAVYEHDGSIDQLRVEDVMRPAPICDARDSLSDAMHRMTARRLRHLIVRDGEQIVGVISVGDIVKHRLEQLETETGVLRDYVAAQRAAH